MDSRQRGPFARDPFISREPIPHLHRGVRNHDTFHDGVFPLEDRLSGLATSSAESAVFQIDLRTL